MSLKVFWALIVACSLNSATYNAAMAQKAPGTYPACEVDNPPSGCGDNMFVEIVTGLALNTGLPVDTSTPQCSTQTSINFIEQVIDLISSASNRQRLEQVSGNLFEVFQAQIGREVLNKTGGAVHNFLLNNGPKASGATCVPIAAYIPRASTLSGYRLFVHDIDAAPPSHWGGCVAGQDCALGFSKFLSAPEEIEGAAGKAVTTTFANWSHDRRRVGHLYVFYKMPAGKKPLRPI